MTLARHYLLLYNTVQCLGWAWVLQRIVQASFSPARAYDFVRMPLCIFQTLAVLEVLHAAVSLVRASVRATALQLGSRLFILWGVVELVPEACRTPAFVSMVTAWSLTEVPRYFYFAFCAQAKPPRALVWLRYSTFLPLYPVGAGSEWLCLYHALPYIKERAILTVAMPNAFNFAFDYWLASVAILALYVPGLGVMYSHMMHQRRKNLGRASQPDTKSD